MSDANGSRFERLGHAKFRFRRCDGDVHHSAIAGGRIARASIGGGFLYSTVIYPDSPGLGFTESLFVNLTLVHGLVTNWSIIGGYSPPISSENVGFIAPTGDRESILQFLRTDTYFNTTPGSWSGPQEDRFSAIPETPIPAALPLFATGLGALGLLTWRRKRKAVAA